VEGSEDIYYFNVKTKESVWDHPCDEHFRKVYSEGENTFRISLSDQTEKAKWLAQQRDDVNRSLTDDLRARPTLSPLRAPITPLRQEQTLSRKKVSFSDELKQQEETERQHYYREYQIRREAWLRDLQVTGSMIKC
jgi:hypothetical protein